MNSIILTKKQIWLIAEAVEKYELDQLKIEIVDNNGIGSEMAIRISPSEKIDITDVSNW
jgi:hypothetical protein